MRMKGLRSLYGVLALCVAVLFGFAPQAQATTPWEVNTGSISVSSSGTSPSNTTDTIGCTWVATAEGAGDIQWKITQIYTYAKLNGTGFTLDVHPGYVPYSYHEVFTILDPFEPNYESTATGVTVTSPEVNVSNYAKQLHQSNLCTEVRWCYRFEVLQWDGSQYATTDLHQRQRDIAAIQCRDDNGALKSRAPLLCVLPGVLPAEYRLDQCDFQVKLALVGIPHSHAGCIHQSMCVAVL